jgi:cytochrome c
MRTFRLKVIGAVILVLGTCSVTCAQTKFGFGRHATEAEIAAWNLDIDRDGKSLPPGGGSVNQGKEIYNSQCAACHGEKGEGAMGDRLVGGQATLATPKPIKTVGSFWPYAPTLFDYVRRSMPMNAPQSLTNDQVYAVTAYILNMNGLVPDDTTLDAKSLAAIKMPNRNGFVEDPRPDVRKKRCMSKC